MNLGVLPVNTAVIANAGNTMIEQRSIEFANEYGTTAQGRKILRIVDALKRNHEKYGESYCPCKVDRIEDNICPCKEFRETGNCICGLYTPDQKPQS